MIALSRDKRARDDGVAVLRPPPLPSLGLIDSNGRPRAKAQRDRASHRASPTLEILFPEGRLIFSGDDAVAFASFQMRAYITIHISVYCIHVLEEQRLHQIRVYYS